MAEHSGSEAMARLLAAVATELQQLPESAHNPRLGSPERSRRTTRAWPRPTIAATTSGAPADVDAAIDAITRCTRGINYLGLPALCVPADFYADGMPIAFQLVGRPFDEATILRTEMLFNARPTGTGASRLRWTLKPSNFKTVGGKQHG